MKLKPSVLSTKKIEEVLSDKESSGKISQIMNLRQQERWLHSETERLQLECRRFEIEVESKHSLGFLDVALLISVLEKKGMKDWHKEYTEHINKRNGVVQ